MFGITLKLYTVEVHLSGLIGMASHPDMQKTQITGFFFENRLHWQYEMENNIYKWLFTLHFFTYKNIHTKFIVYN